MKKLCSGFCSIILILSVMISTPAAYAEEEDVSFVNDAQYGIVRVLTGYEAYEKEKGDLYYGTAFAVGKISEDPEYFVTNYHVVESDTSDVRITIDDMYHTQKAKVVYFDSDKDIAILKTYEPVEDRKALVLLPSDKVEKSQSVWCLGFPGLSDLASDGGNSLSSQIEDITISSGTVSNNNYKSNGVRYIMTDAILNGGNSGGPMVNHYGQVIAVNTMVIWDTNAMSMSISIDQVMDILDKKDIDYMIGDTDGSAVSSDGKETFEIKEEKSGAWIFIALSAVICIGAAFAIYYFKKNKININKNKIAPAYTGADSMTVTVDTGNYNSGDAKLEITCEVGPGGMMGRKWTYPGKVRVGRNVASCQILFPEGTPGVSREHCDIRLTSYGIIVKDLNSTYGTILGDGTKLSSGVEKNIGSEGIILLGSEKIILSCKKIGNSYVNNWNSY